MSTPPRLDLREGTCFPYLPSLDQGSEQSCVAHAFAAGLYCVKRAAGAATFPSSGRLFPRQETLFEEAALQSHDRSRGVSFEGVIASVFRQHGEDLRQLGWKLVRVPNDREFVKRRLLSGAPVVVGYQVDPRIYRFHTSAAACEQHGYLLPPFGGQAATTSAHAVLIVGYDDAVGSFLARNSWGQAWGVDGHFLIRYEDLENPEFFTDVASFARA